MVDEGGPQDRVAPEPAAEVNGSHGPVYTPVAGLPEDPTGGVMVDALGFVKLYRKVLANPIWKQCSPAVWKVFCLCLIEANWKENQWFDGRKTVILPAGSLVTSLNSICEKANVSRKQARDALDWLVKLEITAQVRTHHYTVVTFTNWAVYQTIEVDEGTVNGTARAHEGHTKGTARALPKEVKKVRREEESQNHSPVEDGEPANGTNHKAQVDALFTRFWTHVWIKTGRQQARKVFPRALKYVCDQRHIKAPEATQLLIDLAKAEPEHALIPGNEYRLAMHPATWLNNCRWEDEIREIHIHRPEKAAPPDFLPNY